MSKPREIEMAKILEIVAENPRVKTIYLDCGMKAAPGQFVMAWVPRMDEKPFSLSYSDGNKIGLSIAAVGQFSKKLHEMKAGDSLGIRGPLGKGFKLVKGNVAVVGGGCGTAPLGFLVEELAKKGAKVTAIIGAKNKEELFFVEKAKKAGAEVVICTDDGSEGRKGFTTDALAELIGKEKFDCVYTCGPEIMMRKIVELCAEKNVECQASLERYMKCGFGLCGQCAIDGLLVCKDGPVFAGTKLKRLKEFGHLRRDASGTEIRA